MPEKPLPKRLIAYGHEPNGERVNTYQKMSVIALIKSTLDQSEINILSKSQFGKILMMQAKPALSGTFALHLLYRPLVVVNENELWFLFSGNPIRFSLREFKIVTGLNCGKFPRHQKKGKKVSAQRKKDFYKELFGLDGDILVSKVIGFLRKRTVNDPKIRLRYACQAFVDAILAPTTHYPKLKINREHVEMSKDLDEFLKYPWGRKSFEMITSSLKKRDITQFATANVAIQGFFYAVQMVVLQDIPAIPQSFISYGGAPSDPEDDFLAQLPQRVTLRVNQLRDLDRYCEAKVIPIINPELDMGAYSEDLTWSDDEAGPLVDNLVQLIEEDFAFDNSMFTGGEIPDQSVVPDNPTGRANRQQTHVRKGKGIARRSNGGKKTSKITAGQPSNSNTFTVDDIVNAVLPHLPGIVAKELVANNPAIVAGITEWLKVNFDWSATSSQDTNPAHRQHTKNPPTSQPNPVDSLVNSEDCNCPTYNAAPATGPTSNVVSGNCASANVAPANADSGIHVTAPVATDLGDIQDMEKDHADNDTEGQEYESNEYEEDDNGDPEEDAEDAGSEVSSSEDGSHISPTASQRITEVMSHYPQEVETDNEICSQNNEISEVQPVVSCMNLPQSGNTDHVIATDTETHQVNCMDAVVTKANDEMKRKSKRHRSLSSRLDGGDYQCDKRIKIAIGQQTSSQAELEREREWRLRRALASPITTYNLGNNITLSSREVHDLLERRKNTTAKVMDALCKFTRHMLRGETGEGAARTAKILDSKFVSSLTRAYPKFSKTTDPSTFQFTKSIVDSFKGTGDPERMEPSLCERLYMPFNFDKNNWVVLCADLKASKISILDSYMSNRTDAALKQDLRPIAVMLPYLITQLYGVDLEDEDMSLTQTNEFQLERIIGILQVASIWDSGVMSVLLMEAHATGGEDHCAELGIRSLEDECKKLVIGLFESYVLC